MFGGTLIVAGAIGIAEFETTGVSRPELKHEVLRPESSPKAEKRVSFLSDSARSTYYLSLSFENSRDCETTLEGHNDKARLLRILWSTVESGGTKSPASGLRPADHGLQSSWARESFYSTRGMFHRAQPDVLTVSLCH